MNHRVAFKWEVSFGHVVQMGAIVIGVVGLYYGLLAGQKENAVAVKQNAANIQTNTESIKKLAESRNDLIGQLRVEADKREERTMGLIRDIKDDVSWLVRREADKSGD